MKELQLVASSGTLFSDERVRLLDTVGRALSAPHDYENAVHTVVRCAVPTLADLAVLALHPGGAEARVEVSHPSDPEREPGIADQVRACLPAIVRAANQDPRRSRQFRWVPVINESAKRFLSGEGELQELVVALGIHSLMVVPLRAGAVVIGGMAFARTDPATPFGAADLAVAQVIARRAALAIESAGLHQRAREEKRRRDRVEDALQKWIQVFELAGWGAAIVDGVDGRMDAVNPAFARMHGYPSSDSLIGRLFTDLLPAELSGELDRWRVQQGDQTEGYESVHLKSDGTHFPVLTSVTGLEIGGEAGSYVVTVQELTELKRAEERLHRAQRMEAVGRLAGGVAHEVNNMMTIVIGFADLLAGAANLPPDRERDVGEIRKAAMRAAKITQQLLAFSRQQVLQPSDLELNDVVGEIASVLQLLLPANVQVESILSPTPLVVHADRAQLDQVLINLAFNARDAMPEGGTIRVTTSSRHLEAEDGHRLIGIPIPARQYACLSVRDTGHGMDPDTLHHVFEPFFTTKPVGAGTGLGLATVYGIVKQSGGFVWVESTVGRGTTFTLSLPQLERRVLEPEADEPANVRVPLKETITVLLLEDEDGVRELARRVLEQEGCRVIEVRTGAEAYATLQSQGSDIDLVLSDVIVPDMATVELERWTRARLPMVAFIYMSGYPREEVVARGLVGSGRPFLQKPFTPLELARTVSQQTARATAAGGGRVTS